MSDRKAKKQTKKEINAVILKYLGKDNDHALQKKIGLLGGPVVALGIGMDLLFTGGIFSMGTACLGAFGIAMGTAGGGCLLLGSREKSRTNTAAQTLKCSAPINDTLEEMESRLRKSFNTAALIYATPEDKKAFRFLAAEIEQDVKKLSPAFKIVSGGPFNTDKYEFTVDKKKMITLTQALRDMNQTPAPEKQPEPKKPVEPKKLASKKEIQQLKARMETLENPKVAKLDKNPPRP